MKRQSGPSEKPARRDQSADALEWRVFVTRPIAQSALGRLARQVRVDLWDDEMPPPADELRRRALRADAVLSMVTDRFDAATIGALPNLKAISNLAVGVDNIDLAAATRAAIPVGHTPGVLTETTADLAFGLLMAAARRIAEGDRYVRAGHWRTWTPRTMLGRDVYGATLGIVGWGAIGQAMARRAAGFAMRVLYLPGRSAPRAESRPDAHAEAGVSAAEPANLKRLLAESDYVSIHVPLSDATRHLIGAAEFAAMKPSAILVNTARGAVVDQQALLYALRTGRIAGAALDVTDPEPIDRRDPLLELPNVVVTPHIGSASHATRTKMAEMAADNLLDVFAGRLPRHCANPAVRIAGRGK